MSNYEFWIELGNIYHAINAYQEKAIEFNKRFITPWLRLGNIFDKQNRSEDAIKAYQKAAELDPENANVWNEIGNTHFNSGAYDQAIAAYNKAIELDPGFGKPYSNLALTYSNQERHDEAIPLFKKSIELLSSDEERAISWNRLGNAYRRLGDSENAIAAYQMADQLDPDSDVFASNLGLPSDPLSGIDDVADDVAVAQGEATVPGSPVDLPAGSDLAGAVTASELVVEGEPVLMSAVDQPVPGGSEEGITLQEAVAEEAAVTDALIVDRPAPAAAGETVVVPEPVPAEVATEDAPVINPLAPVATGEAVVVPEAPPADAVSKNAPVGDPLAPASTGEAVVVPEAVPADVVGEDAPVVDPFAPAVAGEAVVVPERVPAEAIAEDALVVEQPDPVISGEAVAVPDMVAVEASAEADRVVVLPASGVLDEAFITVEPADVAAAEAEVEAAPVYSQTEQPGPDQVSLEGAPGNIHAEIDSKSAHVWNELGNIYISIGAHHQAVDSYQKAIELDPGFGWPYSNLALTFSHQGRYAEAIPLYMKSIELLGGDKERAISWNRLGNAYRNMNHYENAVTAYQTAIDLDPNSAASKDSLSWLHAVPAATGAAVSVTEAVGTEQAPVASAVDQCSLAASEEAEAVPEAADADAPVAVQPAPVAPEETVLVPAAAAAGDDSVTQAVDWPASEASKETAAVSGEVTAEDDVVALVDDQPDPTVSEEAAGGPGVMATEQDVVAPVADQPAPVTDGETAVVPERAAEAAPVVDRPAPVAVNEPLQAAELVVAGEIATAETQDMQSCPEDTVLEEVQGQVCAEGDSKNAHVWNEMGRNYFNKGRYDQAAYAYNKAIELDPGSGQPYSSLGSTYLQQGKYAEAIPLYQRSVELLEDDRERAISWNKLGNAYRRLGDYDKAIAAYQMADELDPTSMVLPTRSWFHSLSSSFVRRGAPSGVGR